MKVEKDYADFIRLLNYHKVKYLIVGAFALTFYASPRNTGDIDFFIEASAENANRILKVLKEFGFGGLDFNSRNFIKKNSIIQLGYPPVRIDIMTSISGVNFSNAYTRKVKGKLGKYNVYFISKDDLIKNKIAAGRKKDIADAELLKKF